MSMVGLNTSAHDIEVKNADGKTIYYNFINDNTELAVTYRGSSSYDYDYSNKYTGNVVIPKSVTYNEKTYSVTSIGNEAFSLCYGLTSVTIGSGVTNIGGSAFYGCSKLTSITIPNSVTSIGSDAFGSCSGLTSITIPNSVTRIGEYVFQSCSKLTSITIPNSVTRIGSFAFNACYGLTSVTIGNSVTSIGYNAFDGCSGLTSITIPNSVTRIWQCAFRVCSSLTSIDIPNSVTSIGYDAFEGTAWYNNQSNGLVYAGKVAYKYKGTMPKNTSITIKDGTLGIADYAFSGCSKLTSITIPNSVTSIGESAFFYCSGLTSINIPNSVTSIGYNAFGSCSGLTSITIPNSVTSIGERAFEGCSGLTSVDIPNSVTSIGEWAFDGCPGLTSITIPNSVTSIGHDAFEHCNNLKSVYALSESPSSIAISDDSFPTSQSTLYVKKGLKDLYSTSKGWKNFVDIKEMTDEQYEKLMKKANGEGGQEDIIVNVPIDVNLSSDGYATFYNASFNFKLPTGLSALVLTSESGQTLNYKTIASGDANGIVPKGVPVILVSSNRRGGTYTLTSTTEGASYSGENLLHGSSLMTMTSNVNGVSTSGNSNYVYYKLAYGKSGSVNANKLGWYWGANNGAAFTIAGGKAWLALPKSSAQSLDAILLEEDDATSIDGIEQSYMNEANDAQYNMAGQRVGNGYNGIIIENGKKVIR